MTAGPLIKVCGLTRAEDAAFCAEAGADWLGFIFHPQSPRRVSPGAVAEFETGSAKRVGVFVDQSPAEVLALMETARLDLAQLHGGQDNDFIRQIGPERVILARWPERFESPEALAAELGGLDPALRAVLFDAGRGGGGHGRSLSLEGLAGLTRPWLLAGGLTAEKAAALDCQSLPNLIGLDFNSGVEKSPGLKDHRLVRAAIAAVRHR